MMMTSSDGVSSFRPVVGGLRVIDARFERSAVESGWRYSLWDVRTDRALMGGGLWVKERFLLKVEAIEIMPGIMGLRSLTMT